MAEFFLTAEDMIAAAAATVPTYRRREPDRTVLHRVVREQLASFLNAHEVPAFVARTLRRFLQCGILAYGFVHVRCARCRKESLVAFPRPPVEVVGTRTSPDAQRAKATAYAELYYSE